MSIVIYPRTLSEYTSQACQSAAHLGGLFVYWRFWIYVGCRHILNYTYHLQEKRRVAFHAAYDHFNEVNEMIPVN